MPDEEAIAAVVERAYDALEFDPGSEPDWALFDSAFAPEAILALRVFPEDPGISVMGLRAYAESQMRNDLGEQGYSETPGAGYTQVYGDVAVVRQSFTMNFADRSVDAIDVFSLVRVHGEWKVVAVVSDTVDSE
ncbi:MAG: putative lumazine-binding [Actinomycetota bacterium]